MGSSTLPVPFSGYPAKTGALKPRRNRRNLWLPLAPFPVTNAYGDDSSVSSGYDTTPALSLDSPEEKSIFEDWSDDEEPRPSIIFGEEAFKALLVTPETPIFSLPPSPTRANKRRRTQQLPVSAVRPHTPYFEGDESDDESMEDVQMLSSSSSGSEDSNKTPVPADFRGPRLSIDTSPDSLACSDTSSEAEFTLSALFVTPDEVISLENPFRAPEVVFLTEVHAKDSCDLWDEIPRPPKTLGGPVPLLRTPECN